jgi:transcription termination factor NusB
MNAQQLLNEILPILHSVKEDKEKLQKILDFLLEEIYEEPDETEPEIPEKYRELVHTVAENIDCGLVCFINPETLEVEEIPKGMVDGFSDFSLNSELEEDEDEDEQKILHQDWETCITVEPRESNESFKIMEKFVDEVNDKNLKNKLINALNNRKPFANFKNIVESSDHRKEWFAFKQRQLEILVWDELEYELEKYENKKQGG